MNNEYNIGDVVSGNFIEDIREEENVHITGLGLANPIGGANVVTREYFKSYKVDGEWISLDKLEARSGNVFQIIKMEEIRYVVLDIHKNLQVASYERIEDAEEAKIRFEG